MTARIISNPTRVWDFVRQQVPCAASGHMKGIGLEVGDALVAGVLYQDWSGPNVWMHVAAVPGKRWMTREFLRYSFYYPFVELGCTRVSGFVEDSNAQAKRFDEHLGFEREAVLKGAARDGGDVVIYVMWRDKCRFIKD